MWNLTLESGYDTPIYTTLDSKQGIPNQTAGDYIQK